MGKQLDFQQGRWENMENMQLYIKHSDREFTSRLAKSFCLCDGVNVYIEEPPEHILLGCIVLSFDIYDRDKYVRYVALSMSSDDEILLADACTLYIFSSSVVIIEKLRFIFGYKVKPGTEELNKCKLMSFVSEKSYCGTSTSALAFSYIMDVRFGIKTAYLSLSHSNYRAIEFLRGSLDKSEKCVDFDDSSAIKFMYALKQRKDLDIDSFLNQSHGISHFNLALINGRLDDFDASLIDEIRKRLHEKGYEYLIIDIGTSLSRQAIEIAESSDNAIFVNCDFLSEYIKPRAKTHKIGIDMTGKNTDEDKTFMVPFCRDLSFRSFDHEYGFEIESILEEILRA